MYTLAECECAITGEPRLTIWLVQANREGLGPAYRLRSQAVDCVADRDLRSAETPHWYGLAEFDIASESIELFTGVRRIDTPLPSSSYHLEYHPDAGRLMARLLERGEKWGDLQACIRHGHVRYTGEAYDYYYPNDININI